MIIESLDLSSYKKVTSSFEELETIIRNYKKNKPLKLWLKARGFDLDKYIYISFNHIKKEATFEQSEPHEPDITVLDYSLEAIIKASRAINNK